MKKMYLMVVAAIAALGNAFSVVTVLLGTARSLSFADAVVSFVIEATAFVALVMVICICGKRSHAENTRKKRRSY